MNWPLMVRCTDPNGEVVDVNLSKGFVWGRVTIEGQRLTLIYDGNRVTNSTEAVKTDDGNVENHTVNPTYQAVRQTPKELRSLIYEARKAAMREEIVMRRELEAELGDA